jgi:hypothetical protein
MGKLLFFLLASAVSYAVWQARRASARRRLKDIDDGRMCIACGGTSLEHEAGTARCTRCGHVVLLAALRAARVDEHEIKNITRPDRRDL